MHGDIRGQQESNNAQSNCTFSASFTNEIHPCLALGSVVSAGIYYLVDPWRPKN